MAFDNGSPYSDFEDMLYDADPGPDLADDLAEHTVHSPPIYSLDDDGDDDVGGFDLVDGYSDWEYYSDDYWDDDPGLLKGPGNRAEDFKGIKDGVRTNGTPQEPAKRGRKRKITEVENISKGLDLGERKKLKDCIRGTVWATPIRERENWYKEGDQEKVALLKDWQKQFGDFETNIKIEKPSKPLMRRDESWANEMSLADMGLTATRGDIVAEKAEEDDSDNDSLVRGEYEEADLVNQDDALSDIGAIANLSREPGMDEYADASSESEPGKSPLRKESNAGIVRRKRRKQHNLPSPPPSNKPTMTNTRTKQATDPENETSSVPFLQNRGEKRKACEEGDSTAESEPPVKSEPTLSSNQESYDENGKRTSRKHPEHIANGVGIKSVQSNTDGTPTEDSDGRTKHSRKKAKVTKGSQVQTEMPRRSTRSTRNAIGN